MMTWEEGVDMDGISVSDADKEAGSPKEGDMIARNPKNHNDMWLVAKQYFEDNLEAIKDTATYKDRLLIERDELSEKYEKLDAALKNHEVPDSAVFILSKQRNVMHDYLHILNTRLD